MTDDEYVLEMLCSLPKELLIRRWHGARNIPEWLKGIPAEDVNRALQHYDDAAFQKLRERQAESL